MHFQPTLDSQNSHLTDAFRRQLDEISLSREQLTPSFSGYQEHKSSRRVEAIHDLLADDKGKLQAAIRQIVDLEKDILKEQEDRKKRNEFISSLQRNFRVLSSFCKDSRKEISYLAAQLRAAHARIETLNSEGKYFTEKLGEIDDLEKTCERLRDSLVAANDRTSIAEEKIQIQNTKLNQLNAQATSQLAHVVKSKQLAENKLIEMEDILGVKERNIEMLTNENELLIKDIDNIKSQNTILNDKLQGHASQSDNLKDKCIKLDNMLRRSQLDRDNLKVDNKRISNTLNKIIEDKKHLDSKLNTANDLIKSLELQTKAFKSTERIQEVHDDYNLLQELHEKDEKKINEMKEEAEKLRMLNFQSTNEIKRLLSERENAKIDYDKMRTMLKTREKLYSDELKAEMNKKKDNVLTSSQLQEIQDTKLKLHTAQTSLANMSREILNLEDTIKTLLLEKEKSQKNISSLQNSLSSLKNDEDKGKDLVTTLTENNTKLQSELTSANGIIAKLTEEKESDNVRLNQIHRALGNLRSERDELSTQCDSFKTRINEFVLEKQQYIIQIRQDSKETNITMTTKIKELNSLLEGKELELKDLTTRINSVQSDTLIKQQTELRRALSKLTRAESASESLFTCLTCMRLYKNPVSVIPCGHNFCDECIKGERVCPHCVTQGLPVSTLPRVQFFNNELIENLIAKHAFRKQTLDNLIQLFGVDNSTKPTTA